MVTVSIPSWQSTDTIRRAVDSVLAQTMGDLAVIVTSDGDDPEALYPLGDITDPRLTITYATTNRGRYACDLAAFSASRSPLFAICDADDWVDPTWLESMMAALDDGEVVLGPHWEHGARGEWVSEVRAFTGEFAWHAHMGAGLYRRSWLERTGVLSDALRVGYDNIVTGLPFLRGDLRYHAEPTYHRVARSGSLTQSPGTGVRSPLRRASTALLRALWGNLRADPEQSACFIASLASERSAVDLIPKLPHSSWSMHPTALVELDALLWRTGPRSIVECGSGLSTVVLARYAMLTGAKVVTLDHDRRFQKDTALLLRQHNLDGIVDLRLASLHGTPPRYATELPERIDFALIDGPPARLGGRAAMLPSLLPHLVGDWTAWLDDYERPEEQAMARDWKAEHKVAMRSTAIPRGTAILTPKPTRTKRMKASGVVIGILTGHRPEMLARTLDSLPAGLLESAYVIALHDGGDEATTEVLNIHRATIDTLRTKRRPDGKMDTIGHNWSEIAELASEHGDYLLMLEDDWQHISLDLSWLDQARAALDDPEVAQVRLRHISEQTRNRHMATRAPIDWMPHPHGFIAEAHVTMNPNLMRMDDVRRLWPADGEAHMQRKAVSLGLSCIVQLNPGAFVHIGTESLRQRFNPPH